MTAAAEAHYGGFDLAGMSLAMPLESLREVHPWCDLVDIPSPSPAVIGGLSLRGAVVPVVDLSHHLAHGGDRRPQGCLIVMVHQGRVMALAADEVTGVFVAGEDRIHPMHAADPVAAVLAGNVVRADQGTTVCLLAADKVFGLPGVVCLDDPEPERQAPSDEVDEQPNAFMSLMLMRCGRVPLAIDAMAVAGTVPAPTVRATALTQGDCLGVLDHAGQDIPAVDLQALCGLGAMDRDQPMQAFVMTLEQGQVALMIGEVLDVVRAPSDAALHVPTFALPAAGLFAGAMPGSVLPGEAAQRAGVGASQWLCLSSEGLRAHPMLQNLASLSSAGKQAGQGFSDLTSSRSMLIYALGGDASTPLEQVVEILPYDRNLSVLSDQGGLLGFIVSRGRSIPVMCLSRLSGLASPAVSPAVSVLVVQHDGEYVGFAVPALRAIEPSDWTPELPTLGQRPHNALAQALSGRRLVQVGPSGQQRLLPLIDLAAIARALLSGADRETGRAKVA